MNENELDSLENPELPANQRLVALIDDIRERLDEFVQAKYVLFHEDVRDAIQEAYVNEIRETQINNLRDALKELENVEALTTAGLANRSLHMKLLEYKHARDKFKKQGGTKAAKDLAEAIHILLGSILTMTNVAEPIKEFVELIKLIITEVDS